MELSFFIFVFFFYHGNTRKLEQIEQSEYLQTTPFQNSHDNEPIYFNITEEKPISWNMYLDTSKAFYVYCWRSCFESNCFYALFSSIDGYTCYFCFILIGKCFIWLNRTAFHARSCTQKGQHEISTFRMQFNQTGKDILIYSIYSMDSLRLFFGHSLGSENKANNKEAINVDELNSHQVAQIPAAPKKNEKHT